MAKVGEGVQVPHREFTQVDFLRELEALHMKCVAISKAKNADYATAGDPFLNFKAATGLGIDPADGILVRMSDKMSRVANLIRKARVGQSAAVVDESVTDTLLDLSNYAIILAMYLKHSKS
jgi:hypothetical protein